MCVQALYYLEAYIITTVLVGLIVRYLIKRSIFCVRISLWHPQYDNYKYLYVPRVRCMFDD